MQLHETMRAQHNTTEVPPNCETILRSLPEICLSDSALSEMPRGSLQKVGRVILDR